MGVDNQTHFLTRSRENEGGVTWGGSASPLDSKPYFLILPGIPVTHLWQALGTFPLAFCLPEAGKVGPAQMEEGWRSFSVSGVGGHEAHPEPTFVYSLLSQPTGQGS